MCSSSPTIKRGKLRRNRFKIQFSHSKHLDLLLVYRIAAHRRILSAANNFFKQLLATELEEKENAISEIAVKGVKGAILWKLTEYCYTGRIVVDGENVDEMTRAAAVLQFDEVLNTCADFYPTILCASNALGIREIADRHNMVRLREIAHGFILDHFMEVSKTDEFYQLNVEHLFKLLKEDGLYVLEEDDVFVSLIEWARYDIKNRTKSYQNLLDFIRFQDAESVSN